MMNETLSALYNAILDGSVAGAKDGAQSALDSGLEPGLILSEGMIAAMKEVGKRFEDGEYFVPEMLISARAMQTGLNLLKPHLLSTNVKSAGKIVIGTVKGDLHDIGKNLVGMMLEGAGFEVLDLGVDVSPEKFAESADRVDVIALSALLTTTMQNMKATIDALQLAGKRNKVKVIIGGAPITKAYKQQIGADGFAPDASHAVAVTKALL